MTEVIDRSGCSAPRHGTRSAYVKVKCRCRDARDATRQYDHARRGEKKTPNPAWLLVDSTSTQRKLQALRAAGWTWSQIGAYCGGESASTMQKLVHSKMMTIPVVTKVNVCFRRMGRLPQPDGLTADRARAAARRHGWVPASAWGDIENDAAPMNDGLVSGVGAQRRLQALVSVGWTISELSTRYGIHADWFRRLQRDERIGPEVADRMDGIYRELWTAPPKPSKSARLARSWAARHGWVSTLAWDDIDDPSERPNLGTKYRKPGDDIDDVAVAEAMAGRLTFEELSKAERRLVVRNLVEQRRWSDVRIAAFLHAADRTVLRIRQELGIPAVPVSRQLDAA